MYGHGRSRHYEYIHTVRPYEYGRTVRVNAYGPNTHILIWSEHIYTVFLRKMFGMQRNYSLLFKRLVSQFRLNIFYDIAVT